MGFCSSYFQFTSFTQISKEVDTLIIGYCDSPLGRFSEEKFIQVLNDYASSQEATDDQRAQISKIILGISNQEFYLKFLNEERSFLVIDITPQTPPIDCPLTCLTDVVEYQQRRILLENSLETLSLVANRLESSHTKPHKKTLPRPPRIIKLSGGKK